MGKGCVTGFFPLSTLFSDSFVSSSVSSSSLGSYFRFLRFSVIFGYFSLFSWELFFEVSILEK